MEKNFKRDFIKGSAATSIGTIVAMIFQFLSIMIITRHVTKEEFGIYVLILVIANFLDTFSGLALEQSVVKFVSSADEQERKSTFFPALIIRIILIVAAIFLVILFRTSLMSLFNFTATEFLYVIIILFILSSFRGLFYNLLQGLNLFKKYASIQTITSVIRVVLLLVIVYLNELTLKNVLLVEIVAVTFTVLLQLALIPYKEIFNRDLNYIKKIIRFSVPLYLSGISYFIQTQVNIFIIGAYLNPVSIAEYDVAGKVPQASAKGFQSFIIVFYPNLSRLLSMGERDAALRLINRSLLTFSIIINMLLLISFLFNNEIIQLLFSDKYLGSALAFSLLMVAFYLSAMSNIMGYSLVSAGLPSTTLKVNIVAGAINLIGAFLMIPIFGFMGAVYALLITGFASLVFHYLYLSKYDMKIELISLTKPSLITFAAILFYYLVAVDNYIIKSLLLILYIIAIYFLVPETKNIFNQIVNHLFKFKSEKGSI